MQTSNFASVKKVESAGLTPVGIAVGSPRWFNGETMLDLAPSRSMLNMSRQDYDGEFREILKKMNPHWVLQEIEARWGQNAVLLCWEAHNVWCHRRLIAEWIENACGIVIPEMGHKREATFKYSLAPAKS